MRQIRSLFLRLAGLFARVRRDRDFADELESHLQLHIEDNIRSGMSPEEARRVALIKLGGFEATTERYRDRQGIPLLESLFQDLRYGLRVMHKNPGFTAVAALTLALGIGANTAVFSVIAALALRPLPVRDPQQLVQLANIGPVVASANFSYPVFVRVRDENQVFSEVCAVALLNSLDAELDGEAEYIAGQIVSGSFFSLLGVSSVAGRIFTADEDREPRASPVAVISYDYWSRRFGADPSAIGRSIRLHGTPFTIIGVTERGFSGITLGRSPDLYLPMMMEPAFHDGGSWLGRPGFHWMEIVGRLKTSISRRAAQTNLAVINREILEEVPKSDWPARQQEDFMMQRLELAQASSGLAFGFRRTLSAPLTVLMAMVGLLLFTACANVAHLLLARGTARRKEIAVRIAIGAGRLRLVRQFVIESMLIALTGGMLGLLLAYWSMPAVASILALVHGSIALDLHPDIRVLAFTASLSILTTLLVGLLPAIRSTRVDLTPSLKEGGRTGSVGRSRLRLGMGSTLVICQVTLSLLLVIGAGLFVRTLAKLRSLDPGFNRKNVLLLSIDPARGGYKGPAAGRLYGQLLERLQGVPGVRSASLSWMTPITGGGGWDNTVWVEGYAARPDEDTTVYLNAVGPMYFETLGIPLLQGREFEPEDSDRRIKPAIINRAMARYFFAETNPLGRKFGWGEGKDREEYEIVGVVTDSKYETMREQPPRAAYLNCFSRPMSSMALEVRTEVDPAALSVDIRREIDSIARGIVVGGFDTLENRVNGTLGNERLMATLSSAFGLLALLVAGIGLYAVTAYSVVRRGREIGIRLALGAKQNDILVMVLRETFWLVLAGFAIGLPCGLMASRLVSGMLFGLRPADPVTLASGAVVLAAVALLACCVPARRAMRVDPMVALREE